MENYEEKIFEFFSTEEHFRNMYKIAGYLPMVKKQLFLEFWDAVRAKLDTLNKTHGSQWTLQLSGGIELGTSKLMLYKDSWPRENGLPVFAFAYQRLAQESWPFSGLFLNNDMAVLDFAAVRAYAVSVKPVGYEHDNDQSWLFWRNTGIDFSKPDQFIRILPDKREVLIDDFASSLFQLATSLETTIENMIVMEKK